MESGKGNGLVTEQTTEMKLSEGATKKTRQLRKRECEVCGDQASGNHYGVYACDGCSGFFKRTSRRSESFLCKSYGVCQVAKSTRTVCKACRFRKCVEVGMNLEGGFFKSKGFMQGTRARSGKFPRLSNSENDGKDAPVHPLVSAAFNSPQDMSSETSTTLNDQSVVSDVRHTNSTTQPLSKAEVKCKEERGIGCAPPNYAVHYVTSSVEEAAQVSSPLLPRQQCVVNDRTRTSCSSVLVSGPLSSHAQEQVVIPCSTGSQSADRVTWPPQSVSHVSHLTEAFSGSGSPTAPIPVQSSSQPLSTPMFCTQQELFVAVKPVNFHSSESLQEASSRLMSASIQFARNLPCFSKTPFRDQVILLEESWKELFLLDAVHWELPLEIAALRTAVTRCQDSEARQRESDIRSIREGLLRIKSLRVDLAEHAHLKAILLFKPDTKGLKDADRVEKIQDEVQVMLMDYVQSRLPDQRARFGKLLLSVSSLHSLAADKPIERVFFKKVEGKDIFEILLSQLISPS